MSLRRVFLKSLGILGLWSVVLGSDCRAASLSGWDCPAPFAEPPGPRTADIVDGGALRAVEVLLPDSLGAIRDRFAGKPGSPLVFVIGESHVALPVQQKVAEILIYLRGAFYVRALDVEGMQGELPLPPLGDSLLARRAVAESELLGRRIDAVSYVALSYPDMHVLGVEDMKAYKDHGRALDSILSELTSWADEFKAFLTNDVATLPLSSIQVNQLSAALQELNKDHDFERFVGVLFEVIGRRSETGKKLSTLVERKEALARAERDLTKPDHPVVKLRDCAMVAQTLRVAHGAEPIALVVGSLHLAGISALLKVVGVSYVTILPSGVSIDPHDEKPSEEDANVYKSWMDQVETPLEKWIPNGRRKPPSPLFPPSEREVIALRTVLLEAVGLLQQGRTEEQVRAALAGEAQRIGLEIDRFYAIPNGIGINFKLRGKAGHIEFSLQPLPQPTAGGPEPLAGGPVGGQYYAFYPGDSGRQPPFPPVVTMPPGGSFEERLFAALAERKRKQAGLPIAPQFVWCVFLIQGSTVVRIVEDHRTVLGASPAAVRAAEEAYRSSPPGPEEFLAAQQLARMLLTGIDSELPSGNALVLYQVSEDDFLHDLSLPFIAGLAQEPDTTKMAKIEEDYTLSWSIALENLQRLSWRPGPVEIGRTVVWTTNRLRSSAQYPAVAKAIRDTSARLNEMPRSGDLLLLLGGQEKEWTVGLEDGSSVSKLDSAIGLAAAVVAVNIVIPENLALQFPQSNSFEIEEDLVMSIGRDLVERISRASGREPLGRVLKERAAEERERVRESLSRQLGSEETHRALAANLHEEEKSIRIGG